MRLKPLAVEIFGRTRELGVFPSKLHTDILSVRSLITRALEPCQNRPFPLRWQVFHMIRRNRPIKLSAARQRVVEEALGNGAPSMPTTAAIRAVISEWKREYELSFDPDKYYDERRATAYSSHNEGSQDRLTLHALAMSGLLSRGDDGQPRRIILDLGCGSGLSSKVIQREGLAVIGVDQSSHMLSNAMDAASFLDGVRADLSQRLPFRRAVFDGALSISAVHYIARADEHRSAAERLQTLFASLAACTAGPAIFQFYPDTDAAATMTRSVAEAAGWDAQLVVDQPHRTDARRWFLHAVPTRPSPPSSHADRPRPRRCRLYSSDSVSVACPLALRDSLPSGGVALSTEHEQWLHAEHARMANKFVRTYKRGLGACASEAPAGGSMPHTAAGNGAREGALTEAQVAVATHILAGCASGVPLSLAELRESPLLLEALHVGADG